MLKNDIRYILKRVLVAVLIAFILFFLKSNHVLAATVPVSSQQFMYTRHTCIIGEVNCTDFWTSGYSSAGTWLDPPTQPSGVNLTRYYLVGVYVRTNATLQTGNTYSFTFRTQFNPKNDNVLNHINALQYNIYVNVNNNWTDTQVASQVCSTRNVVTHDYAIETTCVFTTNAAATGVLVRSIYSFTKTPEHITTSNFHIESTQNEVGILTEINTTIKSITADIINNITINAEKEYEYLTDDSDPSVDVSGMSGITGILPAGPVDSLLSLPITILNIFIDSTSGTCSPLTFNFVFNEPITFPCFNVFWDNVPNGLMLFLSDLPACLLFVYWAKSVYKRVERATMFESSIDDEWGGI